MVNRARMEDQLVLHEGLRLAPYLDTEGYWTLGVGYNFSTRGSVPFEAIIGRSLGAFKNIVITEAEARLVLRADIDRLERTIPQYFPEYNSLNEVRQRVCLDLAFNMGFKALGFKQTIACIKKQDWSGAARNLWQSKWAGQVGDGPGKHWDRADRLTKMLLTGLDYKE